MSPGAAELAMLIATLIAAAAALVVAPRWRFAAAIAALTASPLLVAIENWDSSRFEDLRDEPLLLAAGAVGSLVAIAALAALFERRPLLFPLAAVAVLAIRVPVDIGGDSAHLLIPLYLVIAAGLFAGRSALRELRIAGHWRWMAWALAATLVLYAIQATYGRGFAQAAENAGFFFAPFAVLLLLLASVEWNRRLLRMALIVVVAEGLLFTAVGAGQFAAGELWWNQKVIEGNQYHEWFRVNSLFWDPNIFGRYLAVAIVLTAAVIAHDPASRTVWVAAGAAGAMVAGLAASFSQSALLALLAGLAVVVAIRWGVRRTAATIAACVAIAALALVISGTPDLSEERLEEESTGRVSLIRGGLELAADKPLAGHGSGSFARAYRKRFGGDGDVAVSSHSEPVTVAAEQGALGSLTYVGLLVVATLALGQGLISRRNEPRLRWVRIARTAVLAAFGVMVANSIAYAAFLTDPITWALLGIGAALAGYERRQAPHPDPRSQVGSDP